MKFAVGDTVRVTGDTTGAGHEYEAGHVGVILEIDQGAYLIETTLDGDTTWWVDEPDLELVIESSHSQVLSTIKTILVLDLPDQIKTSVIKTLVDSL